MLLMKKLKGMKRLKFHRKWTVIFFALVSKVMTATGTVLQQLNGVVN